MIIYGISGVWHQKTPNNHVSHVQLHTWDTEKNTVTHGVKKTKDDIVLLIQNRNKVITMPWNYNNACWKAGAEVEIYHVGVTKYLRTKADATTSDNLDNMLNMSWLGF